MVYKNREHAGIMLAEKLKDFSGRKDVLLFALPRGGVVVADEVAKVVKLPLDVIVTRKIGAPYNEEYAIGALAETGETVWNEAERKANDPKKVEEIVQAEKVEATRRIDAYRQGRPLPTFDGKTIIIIDDGIATGLTMKAAILAARHQNAGRIIVAVPHGAKDSVAELRGNGVEVIALEEPDWYGAVGHFYREFPQVEDKEVNLILSHYADKK